MGPWDVNTTTYFPKYFFIWVFFLFQARRLSYKMLLESLVADQVILVSQIRVFLFI